MKISANAPLSRIHFQMQAPPTGGPLKALIFDSYYDAYRGVVVYFRVMDGEIRPKVGACVRGTRVPTTTE